MTALFWVSIVLSSIGLLFGVWAHGYNFGIKDTERRWRNAVERAGHK